jgi:hypothetical protein
MTKSLALPLTLLALGILVLAGVLLLKPFDQALGGAFTGSAAYLQMATTTVVGPQDASDTIFSAKSDNSCKSRVVTVPGSATGGINIIFGDPTNGDISSTTLSGAIGHYQAASTTVAYDGEIYGCGRWTAYAWATSTLIVSEF